MSEYTISHERPTTNALHYRLRVNSFDRLSSLLVSLLVIVGALLCVLLILFLFRGFSTTSTVQGNREIIFNPGITRVVANDLKNQLEAPAGQELPDTTQPKLLEKLQDLSQVAKRTAFLGADEGEAPGGAGENGQGYGVEKSGDTGTYASGPQDPPKELRFNAESLDDYARMIDYFGGELAVIARDQNKIYYARDLSKTPNLRVGSPIEENQANRFRFMATGPPLQPMEVKLARKAGIMRPDAIILVFYPNDFARMIYSLEEAEMRKNGYDSSSDIERTIFRARKNGNGYTLVIEKQTYL